MQQFLHFLLDFLYNRHYNNSVAASNAALLFKIRKRCAVKGSFLSKLDSNVRKLSKGHKKIASYIKENYDKAAFMTASALGPKSRGQREYRRADLQRNFGFKG